jgi:hypothetical protein
VVRNSQGAQGSSAGGTVGGPAGSTSECEREWEHIPTRLGAWGANDGVGLGRAAVWQAGGGAWMPRHRVATRTTRQHACAHSSADGMDSNPSAHF